MVGENGVARASGTFPPNWYDELRPTWRAAIAALRLDLLALTRANMAWDDAFAQWQRIATRVGRTLTSGS